MSLVTRMALTAAVALLVSQEAQCASLFRNLNFEEATIAPTPAGSGDPLPADPALAFPGWAVASAQFTLHNNFTLGTPAQVLIGPNFPTRGALAPLQGSYSALLQYGPGPFSSSAFLSQTGLVPGDAHFITFLVSPRYN